MNVSFDHTSHILALFDSAGAERLGWTLLHSLWQFAAVAILLAIGLALMSRRSAQARYLLSCAALLGMVLLAAGTFFSVEVAERVPPIEAANTPPSEIVSSPAAELTISELPPFTADTFPDVRRAAIPETPPSVAPGHCQRVSLREARSAGGAAQAPRSLRPSACTAKRPLSRGCTGSLFAQGQPPNCVRW